MPEQPWQRISNVESLMLQDANPNNPVVITAIFSLSKPPTEAWLHDLVLPRLLRHPRFSARVVFRRNHRPEYVPVPDFAPRSAALRQHIVTHDPIDPDLPFADRHAQFTKRVAQIISEPLSTDAPLWRLHVLPAFSVTRPDPPAHVDCATLVFRIHHSVADGIGLMKFFLSEILDQPDGAPTPLAQHISAVPRRQNHLTRAAAADDESTSAGAPGPDAPVAPSASQPLLPSRAPSSLPRRAYNFMRDMLRTTLYPLFPDPETVLTRAPLTGAKTCAVIAPAVFPLDTLKTASRRLGVTLNDVLYAAAGGAIASYVRAHGDAPERKPLRVAIPFNAHMLDAYAPRDVRNNFAVLVLPLHADATDRVARLRACADTAAEAKEGAQPAMAVSFLGLVACLHRAVMRPLWMRLTRCSSLLFTNMPGPKTEVSIGDIVCEGMHFFAPGDGEQGVILGLLSYNGKVCVALSSDESRIAEPDKFLAALREEVDAYIEMSKQV